MFNKKIFYPFSAVTGSVKQSAVFHKLKGVAYPLLLCCVLAFAMLSTSCTQAAVPNKDNTAGSNKLEAKFQTRIAKGVTQVGLIDKSTTEDGSTPTLTWTVDGVVVKKLDNVQVGTWTGKGYDLKTFGIHTIKLTVENDNGTKKNSTQTITLLDNDITEGKIVPIASFSWAPKASDNKTVIFKDGSTISDNTPTTSKWVINDNSSITLKSDNSYTFTKTGIHKVKLTVTSSAHGTSKSVTQDVVVSDNPLYITPAFKLTADDANGKIYVDDTTSVNDKTATVEKKWLLNGVPTELKEEAGKSYFSALTDGMYIVTLDATAKRTGANPLSVSVTFDKEIKVAYQSSQPMLPPDEVRIEYTINGLEVTFKAILNPDHIKYTKKWFIDGRQVVLKEDSKYTFAGYGQYYVEFEVSDGSNTIKANEDIYIPEPEPEAPAPTAAFSVATDNLKVTLKDTSRVEGGTITERVWRIDGDNLYLAPVDGITNGGSYTFTKAGTYNISLTVKSNRGKFATTTQNVTVGDSNIIIPTADFDVAIAYRKVTLTDKSSTSDGSGLRSVTWYSNDKPITLDANSYTFAADGSYVIRLDVTSRTGNVSSKSTTVTVQAAVETLPQPKASFTYSVDGLTVALNNTSTVVNGIGSIKTAVWYVDNKLVELVAGKYTFDTYYKHTVKLTVTSDTGYSDSTQQEIFIPMRVKLSVKSSNSFGINKNGTVYAWGNGPLGDGTADYHKEPILVNFKTLESGIKFTNVGAGDSFGFATDERGNTWSWGNNNYGQLGNGTTNTEYNPIKVKQDALLKYNSEPMTGGANRIVEISAGANHVLAVDMTNRLYAWGSNANKQLTSSVAGNVSSPTEISTVKAIKVAAGNGFSVIIGTDKKVYAWGKNDVGQSAGNKYGDDVATPTAIAGLTGNFVAIAAGNTQALAVNENGEVYAWGTAPLGNGTSNDSEKATLVNIPNSEKIIQVANGGVAINSAFSIALTDTGKLYVWGYNLKGQLGLGENTETKTTPVLLSIPKKIISISAGLMEATAVAEDGTAYTWGYNEVTRLYSRTPVLVRSPF